MRKNEAEIYNQIVHADIGQVVCTRHRNGMEYSATIEDTLRQQGYVNGRDYARIFDYGTCRTFIKKLSGISEYSQPKHDLKIGDIVYNSWGWEQTNIDYFQVVGTSEKTVSIRAIQGISRDYDGQSMSGKILPDVGNFCSDEILRKTPYLFMGKWCMKFENGAGAKWDGEPMAYTSYA